MATQSLFDRILSNGMKAGMAPGKTQEARDWFRKKAQKERSTKRKDVLAEQKRQKTSIGIGKMYFFQYDAKTKDDLPYWDAFPLVFPFKDTGKHFYGINMHYLPPQMRARLMDALYSLASDTKYNENTRLMLSYKVLVSASKFKGFEHCVKKYLKKQVRSKFIEVSGSEWDIALWLPFAQWRKSSVQKVYSDAMR